MQFLDCHIRRPLWFFRFFGSREGGVSLMTYHIPLGRVFVYVCKVKFLYVENTIYSLKKNINYPYFYEKKIRRISGLAVYKHFLYPISEPFFSFTQLYKILGLLIPLIFTASFLFILITVLTFKAFKLLNFYARFWTSRMSGYKHVEGQSVVRFKAFVKLLFSAPYQLTICFPSSFYYSSFLFKHM